MDMLAILIWKKRRSKDYQHCDIFSEAAAETQHGNQTYLAMSTKLVERPGELRKTMVRNQLDSNLRQGQGSPQV